MAQIERKISTTRRAVICTAAGLTTAAALRSAIGATATPDPLLELCARWHEQEAACRRAGSDDALLDAETGKLCDIQRAIAATPATTREGALAKLAITEHELGVEIDDEHGPDVMQGLLLSALADFRQFLAGGSA